MRSPQERENAHPVYAAFLNSQPAMAFARDDVRARVIPAYMGLIAQADAEFGRLLDRLEATGALAHTMIVLTSDHGDYLGDHWMGEKDLFHDPSVRVPLIVYDPRAAADITRGTVCDALVESIDLAPTFVAAMGGTPAGHILEGRDLAPWLHGQTPAWRDAVFSEYDYSGMALSGYLGLGPRDARLFMVFDGRWKLIHAEGGFRPMLFDLQTDPQELHDLGADPAQADTIARLQARLADWARRPAQRTTVADADVLAMRGGSRKAGILLGAWDAGELPPATRNRLMRKP